MTAQSARLGAMRWPHRHRRVLTCRVMPRHFDFLSVGEEFGADACSLANATRGTKLLYRERAKSVTVQFLTGNCHQYRESQRRDGTSVPGY